MRANTSAMQSNLQKNKIPVLVWQHIDQVRPYWKCYIISQYKHIIFDAKRKKLVLIVFTNKNAGIKLITLSPGSI